MLRELCLGCAKLLETSCGSRVEDGEGLREADQEAVAELRCGGGDGKEENAAHSARGQKRMISLYHDELTSCFWIGKAVLEPRVLQQPGRVREQGLRSWRV